MSLKSFESAFRQSNKNSASTLDEIQQLMRLFAARGDAKKLHFSHTILSQMCQAIVAGGTNYELYYDVFINVLAPNVEPASSPKYWSAFLEMVRYFYFLNCERKIYSVMIQIYNWIAQKPNKLQNERDYEFLLCIYTQHMMIMPGSDFETTSDCNQRLGRICSDLGKLFEEMLVKNKELNFVYSDLLKTIVRYLITKKTHKFIVYAPDFDKMFDALFVLMSELRGPQIKLVETQELFIDYMSALMLFMTIDALTLNSLTYNVALRYLRTARDLSVFKSHKNMAYAFSLLYYYVKFAYCLDGGDDTSQSYAELCENFRKFFSRHAETLKSEQWFMEFIVVMILLISQQDVCKSKVFGGAVMNADVISLHLQLVMDLIKLASSITQTKLMSFTCCTSTRKHAILSLARIVLKIYAYYVSSVQKVNVSIKADDELKKALTMIIRHSVQVIDSMTCINSLSTELVSFHNSFLFLLAKVQLASHFKICIDLIAILLKLQTKFTPQMWLQLFVRLRRAAPLTKECNVIAELHAIHIAYMVKLKELDYSVLLNEIAIFYTSYHLLVWDKCLLEVLEMSSSPLKPSLDVQEKRQLHTFETQIVYKYQKTNVMLYASLLKCSPTHLHYILVSRECKDLESHIKVKRIYKGLKKKVEESNGLKRIEKLTLAHACTVLACAQVENMKKNFEHQQQKDFCEETLELYLINEKIARIDIKIEIQLIEVILEGVQYFEEFFQTFDLEPLSSQAMLMDWDAMTSDVSFLARLLQLRGYLEYACRAWLLLYNIANFLDDSNNILRALAFLCEHAAFIEQFADINLLQEVTAKQQTIITNLNNIQNLVPRRQNYLLLCLCHMAFFYARQGHFNYANMLLNLVQTERNKLPERRDKFDFIAGSLHAVKFRILWKFKDKSEAVSTDYTCLLRQIEATFSSFRGFVYISSEDSINYMILLFGLVQEFSECTVNRLSDSNVKSYFVSILKGALETGATLRVVQTLTSWAMANLQMERVDKAQSKLVIIECFLGAKNVQHLMKAKASMKSEGACKSDSYKQQQLLLQNNPGVEVMRRVAETHLSPVMKDKLTLSSNASQHCDLQRFLIHDFNEAVHKHNCLQWTYLTIGWTNARLLFLIEENMQLEKFYREAKTWCHKEKSEFLSTYFQNMQLMGMQHYLNYLRTTKQYAKALGFVDSALSFFAKSNGNVDKVYSVNLEVQKRATQHEMLYGDARQRESLGKLRRVLQFGDLSPEEDKPSETYENVGPKRKNRVILKDITKKYAKFPPPVKYETKRYLKRTPQHQKNNSIDNESPDALNSAFIGTSSPESDEVTSTVSIELESTGAAAVKTKNDTVEIPIIGEFLEVEETVNSISYIEEAKSRVIKLEESNTKPNSNTTASKEPKTKNTSSYKKNTKKESNIVSSHQDEDSVSKMIEQINLVDSEDEENISPIACTSKIDTVQPVKSKGKSSPLPLSSDIINKMELLDISPTTPSPENITIIENPLANKVNCRKTRNRILQPVSTLKCVNNDETPKSSDIAVKKRGRTKRVEADIEVIKPSNVVERTRTTRRRPLT